MADQDQADKTEDPTHKKLSDARDKGQVPKSRELNTWLLLATATLILLTLTPGVATRTVAILRPFIESPHDIATDFASLRLMMMEVSSAIVWVMALGALGLMVAAAGGSLMQHGLVWAAESLKPDLGKLSLIKGFKRQFSLKALVEFAKGLGKLVIVAVVVASVILPDFDNILLLVHEEVTLIPAALRELSLKLLAGVLAVLAAVAGLDLIYQRYEFTKQQRMSRRDIKDEHKQTEGDPMVKARLRSIRMEKARRRMMAAVPKADVVITNPTHYAVALKYDEVEMDAPVVVAKGVDIVAERIREVAREHNVPIVQNPPLARTLFTVDLDHMIPLDVYKAAAEVISYVWRLKGHRRRDRAPS